jgi:hypothetical protein
MCGTHRRTMPLRLPQFQSSPPPTGHQEKITLRPWSLPAGDAGATPSSPSLLPSPSVTPPPPSARAAGQSPGGAGGGGHLLPARGAGCAGQCWRRRCAGIRSSPGLRWGGAAASRPVATEVQVRPEQGKQQPAGCVDGQGGAAQIWAHPGSIWASRVLLFAVVWPWPTSWLRIGHQIRARRA